MFLDEMNTSDIGIELCDQTADEEVFHPQKYIICQRNSNIVLKSNPNGREKIIAAADVRRDIVYWHLLKIEADFYYHMSNECYKQYTLQKTLNAIKKRPESSILAESETV